MRHTLTERQYFGSERQYLAKFGVRGLIVV